MDSATVAALKAPSDEPLLDLAAERGFIWTRETWFSLLRELDTTTDVSYQNSARAQLPALGRVGRVALQAFEYDGFNTVYQQLSALAVDRQRIVVEIDRLNAMHWPNMSVGNTTDKDLALIDSRYEQIRGDKFDSAKAGLERARGQYFAVRREFERSRVHLRRSIELFRETGELDRVCVQLGLLGSVYNAEGKADSTLVAYEEALAIALDHRFPFQAARLLNFFARFHQRRGRLALANDLFRQSLDIARNWKTRNHEVRFVAEAMEFYAQLQSWNVVGRLLERGRLLAKQYGISEAYGLTLSRLEGCYLLALGEVDRARPIMEHCVASAFPHEVGRSYLTWGEGLITNGKYRDAVEVLRRGAEWGTTHDLERTQAELYVMLGKAATEVGDLALAEDALAKFRQLDAEDELEYPVLWIEQELIEARIAGQPHGDRQLQRSLAAYNRVQAFGVQMNASAQAYIRLADFHDVRASLLRNASDDAELAYGFSVSWASLFSRLGADTVSTAQLQLTASKARELARDTADRLQDTNAAHLVFGVGRNQVTRSWAFDGIVGADTVALSPNQLREVVGECVALLTSEQEQSAAPSPGLVTMLGDLARKLIPPELLAVETRPRRFYVTCEDVLRLLPFEALHVGSGDDYRPLLSLAEVAYYRPTLLDKAEHHKENSTVMSGCGVPVVAGRRLPFVRELNSVTQEIGLVSSRWENVLVVDSEAAQKLDIMSRWENSRNIYVAGHLVRDPEVPFLSMLSIRDGQRQWRQDESFIDFQDVRGLDLSGTRLVVLSSCGSGGFYATASFRAPTIAEAFIDSGAELVVQTFWQVQDEFATVFAERMLSNPATVSVSTICEERRKLLNDPDSAHPSHWANYSAIVGRL